MDGILQLVDYARLYYAPSIIRIIKSRRTRWAGHIERMGEKGNAYRLLVRNYNYSRLPSIRLATIRPPYYPA
jgi:hypothetical protein